ncbi:MAG: hypothetical protein Q8O72_05805 [Bacteroidales bacterium]|nr:hypothetical protein [Bacteroidales bacterium]
MYTERNFNKKAYIKSIATIDGISTLGKIEKTMAEWIHDFSNLNIQISELGKKMLFIVGPTGSGKSHLADLICSKSNKFIIVPNCTTRMKRESDTTGHFKYVNNQEFYTFIEQKDFFLARKSPLPHYGYLKDDINSIISSNFIAIFMFRFSGIKYIHQFFNNYNVIFLTSNPEILCEKSKDIFSPPCLSEINMNLKENENLYEKIKRHNKNTFYFKNDFKTSLKGARDIIIERCSF